VASVLPLAGESAAVKTQLVVASLMAVAIWCCLAVNVTPSTAKSEIYRPAPPAAPAKYEVPCHERAFVCKAQKRMEKVKL
jgi:hypothetical protein